MELRFVCPTCGQHLSAIPAQIGVTAPRPNCNAAVTVPMQSTLRPRLTDVPPQPQQPAENPHPALVKRTKVRPIRMFGIIAVIGAIAVGAWFVYDSHKSELFAKVQVTPKVLRITNGNDTAWDSTRIILNDAFAATKQNYEKHQAPLLINITRSAFSASAPTIAVIICYGSDVVAPAFKCEQELRRQRHVEDQSRDRRLEPRCELDAPNHS